MSCVDYKDQILKFDHLSQHEQDHLLDHIENCEECQIVFDYYLTLEEELDAVLQDETIDLFSIKKRSRKQTWQRALLVCASLLLLSVCAWYTPPVKAVIEKALNLLILDKVTEMRENVEGLENDEPDNPYVKVIFGIEVNQKKEKITSYVSGNKFRGEYENRDFKISDGEKTAFYSKEENLFSIEKSDEKSSIEFEKEQFKNWALTE